MVRTDNERSLRKGRAGRQSLPIDQSDVTPVVPPHLREPISRANQYMDLAGVDAAQVVMGGFPSPAELELLQIERTEEQARKRGLGGRGAPTNHPDIRSSLFDNDRRDVKEPSDALVSEGADRITFRLDAEPIDHGRQHFDEQKAGWDDSSRRRTRQQRDAHGLGFVAEPYENPLGIMGNAPFATPTDFQIFDQGLKQDPDKLTTFIDRKRVTIKEIRPIIRLKGDDDTKITQYDGHASSYPQSAFGQGRLGEPASLLFPAYNADVARRILELMQRKHIRIKPDVPSTETIEEPTLAVKTDTAYEQFEIDLTRVSQQTQIPRETLRQILANGRRILGLAVPSEEKAEA